MLIVTFPSVFFLCLLSLGGCLLVIAVLLMSGGCKVMSNCFTGLFAVYLNVSGFNQSNFMLIGKVF